MTVKAAPKGTQWRTVKMPNGRVVHIAVVRKSSARLHKKGTK